MRRAGGVLAVLAVGRCALRPLRSLAKIKRPAVQWPLRASGAAQVDRVHAWCAVKAPGRRFLQNKAFSRQINAVSIDFASRSLVVLRR